MIAIRLFVLLVAMGIGGSVLAWLVTGNPAYRKFAWLCFRVACVLFLIGMLLLALGRLI